MCQGSIFRKSEIFPKIWKFSENLKIFRKTEIFSKIRKFPKIWNFSKNLKLFPKILNFSKNLKLFRFFFEIWLRFWGQVITLIRCLKGNKSLGLLNNCQNCHKGDGARPTNQPTDIWTYRAVRWQLKTALVRTGWQDEHNNKPTWALLLGQKVWQPANMPFAPDAYMLCYIACSSWQAMNIKGVNNG